MNILLINVLDGDNFPTIFDEGDDEDEGDDLFSDLGDQDGIDVMEFRPVPDDEEQDDLTGNSPTPDPSASATQSTTTNPIHRPRSAMPKWLSQEYADHRERLTAEIRKNAGRKPSCYEQGSFISGPSHPFFSAWDKAQPSPNLFYAPRFEVWIPHLLMKSRIPCPNCASASRLGHNSQPIFLNVKGWPKAPRRIVDLERCIYLIGYRYLCPHQLCKKAYLSWSPALLSALPRAISMLFTHHLTYRGGLTDRVVSMLRASFLRGIGPGPFAETIRINHLRRYEQRQLQYLEIVYARQHSAIAKLLGKFEPFGAFNNRNAYAGFVPSARYFRDFYIHFISSHASSMDQYTAMLSARILQIDASFKVRKFYL